MMKVALVGIGGMGNCHFMAYKNISDVEVVAVCDIDEEKLKEKTEGSNVRLYTDFYELIEKETVDYVDICTPTYLHAEYSIKAMEKGFNVLCEKPMSLNTEETQAILDTVEKTGKIYMVAHVVRFMKNYMYLKNVIDSKKYGKLLRMDMKRISVIPKWSYKDWFQDEEKSGLVALDMMIHDADFMQYCLGMPEEIIGVNYNIKECNNYLAATYIYDGCTVSIETGWYDTDLGFISGYHAIFEKGWLDLKKGVLTDNGQVVDFNETTIDNGEDVGINIKADNSYASEIEYFIECIKKGKKPEMVTPVSSADSIKLIEMTRAKMIEIN